MPRFPRVYVYDNLFWPPVQMINFTVVPAKFRLCKLTLGVINSLKMRMVNQSGVLLKNKWMISSPPKYSSHKVQVMTPLLRRRGPITD